MPVISAEPSPPTTAQGGGTDGNAGAHTLSRKPIPHEIATPISPPATDSNADSIRNCHSTSRRRAPIAMRVPISLVRSVTLITITLAMPMPPMIKLTAARANVAIPICALI